MTVHVALNFPDFAAAQAWFARLGTAVPQPIVEAPAAPLPVAPEVAPVVEPPKAKPGRKPKADAAPEPTVAPLDVAKGDPLPASVGAAPTPPDASQPPKVWTLDEVRAELQKVSAKFGIDAVREIVVGVGGTARISDVPADKYAAVVAAAIAKVAA